MLHHPFWASQPVTKLLKVPDSLCPLQQPGERRRIVPWSRWGKLSLREVKWWSYGQNPTWAPNDAFPTLFQLASGLRLLQKYGESYETFCLKKKMGTDIYMQMMCIYPGSISQALLEGFDKNPHQLSKHIHLYSPSLHPGCLQVKGREGCWSPLPTPALKERMTQTCIFSVEYYTLMARNLCMVGGARAVPQHFWLFFGSSTFTSTQFSHCWKVGMTWRCEGTPLSSSNKSVKK